MSTAQTASNLVDLALDDLLIGVAEGLTEAQQALDAQRRDADGRPRPYAYAIPSLDFEIKATCTIEQGASGARMRWRPVTLGAASAMTASVTSSVRGRIVAAPQAGSEGPARIDLVLSGTRPTITVTATVCRVTGEPVAGVEISFDIWPPVAGARFDPMIARSGTDGRASATLHVASVIEGGTSLSCVVATDHLQSPFHLVLA